MVAGAGGWRGRGESDLFLAKEIGLAKRDRESSVVGRCVVGTNGLLNNVWVCRVRGDSRHCRGTSRKPHLCCLFPSSELFLPTDFAQQGGATE